MLSSQDINEIIEDVEIQFHSSFVIRDHTSYLVNIHFVSYLTTWATMITLISSSPRSLTMKPPARSRQSFVSCEMWILKAER